MPRNGLESTDEGDKPVSVNSATIGWLVPLVFVANLVVLGLLLAYGFLNSLPDIPDAHQVHPQTYVTWASIVGVMGPTLASLVFLLPMHRWSIRRAN